MNYSPSDGFPYYLHLAGTETCASLFSNEPALAVFNSIDEAQAEYRYAPGKWSLKQVLGHITDHERIKMYRAFQLSRQQDVVLWGYDQNALLAHARFDALSIKALANDYVCVRRASASFVASLSAAQLGLRGRAGQYELTLEDFLKSVIGHEIHHLNSIATHYLP